MNKAVLFNGTSGNITVSDDSAIQNIFDGGGTIEIWINARSDGEGNAGRILDRYFAGGGWRFLSVAELSGKIKLEFWKGFDNTDGDWITTATEVTLNTWTHIVLTYDNGDVANDPVLYINGSLVALSESSTPVGVRRSDVGLELYMGNDILENFTFDGAINEVRLYRRIIGATEASNNYNGGAGRYWPSDFRNLVGWWHLNEGTGTNVRDETSRGNAGTIATVIETLRPNAAGDECNITEVYPAGNSCPDHWESIDTNDDSDYVEEFGGGSYLRDLYNIPSRSEIGPINKITVYNRARGSQETGDQASLKIAIKTGGTVYEDTPRTITWTLTDYSKEWTTNPDTGLDWTTEDIASLQIGTAIRAPTTSNPGSEWSRVTQVYVEVDFTPAFTDGFDFMNMTHVPRRR